MHQRVDFGKLLAATFVSQSGSYFLTIALAASILAETGSLTQASFVFVLSYLPAILGSARLGDWIDRHPLRGLLIRNDLYSVVATLLCGWILWQEWHIGLLALVLALRSVLTFIFRTGTTAWVKRITPPEWQGARIKLTALCFFLSTAMAGLMASVVLKQDSLSAIIAVDVITYLVSVAILVTMNSAPPGPRPEQTDAAGPMDTLRGIFRVPAVRRAFLFVAASQALFQGAYTALVSYLPITRFGLEKAGTGYFQLAASAGITLGFVLVWFLPRLLNEKEEALPVKSLALGAMATAALVGAGLASGLALSLLAFFLMNLTYECIWLHHFAEFFRATPKHAVGRYQFVLVSTSSFLMSVLTLVFAAAIDWSFPEGLLITLVVSLLLVGGVALFTDRRAVGGIVGVDS